MQFRAWQQLITLLMIQSSPLQLSTLWTHVLCSLSDQGSKLSSVQMELPQTLLREAPTFELGDADDPMSSWIFGKGAEIFQYKFIGEFL